MHASMILDLDACVYAALMYDAHNSDPDAYIYDAANFVTNRRTVEQADSRSWMKEILF